MQLTEEVMRSLPGECPEAGIRCSHSVRRRLHATWALLFPNGICGVLVKGLHGRHKLFSSRVEHFWPPDAPSNGPRRDLIDNHLREPDGQ